MNGTFLPRRGHMSAAGTKTMTGQSCLLRLSCPHLILVQFFFLYFISNVMSQVPPDIITPSLCVSAHTILPTNRCNGNTAPTDLRQRARFHNSLLLHSPKSELVCAPKDLAHVSYYLLSEKALEFN